MDSYFNHHYISNSDLKKLQKMINPDFQDPSDLEEIFAFGRLVEDCIMQPHQANYEHQDIEKALSMARTFKTDPICQQLLWVHDLRRQHEWYRSNRFGVPARCKMDGDSRALSLVFELKGLSVETDRAFDDAVNRFHYDQGIAWYLDVSGYRQALLVAVSKKNTSRLFKRIVNRQHDYYKRGVVKIEKNVKLFLETFPEYKREAA